MKSFLISIFIMLGIYESLPADSPLTSVCFSEAYSSHPMIATAKSAKGKLTTELMEYLSEDGNPIDVKMAIINQLGWDPAGRNNAEAWFKYLRLLNGYDNRMDMETNAGGYELLCYAYLLAMDNYFEVDEAIEYAERAKSKKPESYTFNIIPALIKAQKALGCDWCEVYELTNKVREKKSLSVDLDIEAIKIIFKYMDLYKGSCKR
jgi:hypothetical protein